MGLGDRIKGFIDPIQKPAEEEAKGAIVSWLGTQTPDWQYAHKRQLTEWVYANVNVIATAVSSIEFELYQVTRKGKDDGDMELQEIFQHELLDLLYRFNDSTTKNDALYVTTAHALDCGEAFWFLSGAGTQQAGERAPGKKPKELYVLVPDYMKIEPSKDPTTQGMIDHYTYRTPDGKEWRYDADEILFLKRPNPKNPMRGTGVVDAAQLTIETDMAASDWNRRFFHNSARPDLILKTDKRLTEDTARRIKSEWNRLFRGTNKAHQIGVMDSGLDVKELQRSQKDMDFLEQQRWLRGKIMAMFGNTPTVLGISEDVNRANAEAGLDFWLKQTVKPYMQWLVEQLNEYLVPLYGDNLLLAFKDPVPDNRSDKVAEITSLVNRVVTVNEARLELGLDEIEGGDVLYQPGQAPIGEDPALSEPLKGIKAKKRPSISKAYASTKMGKKKEAPKLESDVMRDVASYLLRKKNGVTPHQEPKPFRYSQQFENEKVEGFWHSQIKITEVHEKKFADRMRLIMDRMHDEVKAKLNTVKTRKKAGEQYLFEEEPMVRSSINIAEPLLAEIIRLEGEEALDFLGLPNPFSGSEAVQEYVTSNALKFSKNWVGTARDRIKNELAVGIKAGEGVPQLQKRVSSLFTDLKKYQAERIARTETLRAANFGTIEAYKESGVVKGKQWLTAVDDRLCEFCEAAEREYNAKTPSLDATVWKVGDTIQGTNGGTFEISYDDVGEPPLHVSCRCTTIPVLFDESELKMIKENAKLKAELDEKELLLEKALEENVEIKAQVDEVIDEAFEEMTGGKED